MTGDDDDDTGHANAREGPDLSPLRPPLDRARAAGVVLPTLPLLQVGRPKGEAMSTARDAIAREIRQMRQWHAERPNRVYSEAVFYLRAVGRTLAPDRSHRIALARAVREAAMVDPQHYAEAHRLAQQVRHG